MNRDDYPEMFEHLRREISLVGRQGSNLDQIADLVNAINEENGWNEEERSEAAWAALAHSEISEAFEEFRNGNGPTLIYYTGDGKPEGMPIEYADALIRILHWFRIHGLSPSKAIRQKLSYNLSRPYKHGGKKL